MYGTMRVLKMHWSVSRENVRKLVFFQRLRNGSTLKSPVKFGRKRLSQPERRCWRNWELKDALTEYEFSFQELEFNRVLETLSGYCGSEQGVSSIKNLAVFDSPTRIENCRKNTGKLKHYWIKAEKLNRQEEGCFPCRFLMYRITFLNRWCFSEFWEIMKLAFPWKNSPGKTSYSPIIFWNS